MPYTFCIDSESSLPAFEQIVQQVIKGINDGVLLPGSRLSPVRQLASDVGLAPNTVAKSYRRLEELGYVRTNGRHGTFVSAGEPDPVHDEVRASALMMARTCRRAGLSYEQGAAILRRAFR